MANPLSRALPATRDNPAVEMNPPELIALYWRWGTYIQAAAVFLIALFFLVLARRVTKPSLWPWAGAWLANFAALAEASVNWGFLGEADMSPWLGMGLYVAFKSLFLLLLVWGSARLLDRPFPLRLPHLVGIAVALGAVAAWLAVPSYMYATLLQNAVLFLVLGGYAIALLSRSDAHGTGWLALALGLRAILGLGEFVGSASLTFSWQIYEAWNLKVFMGNSSSLDAAAESLIALTSLLLLYEIFQRNLRGSNAELERTRARLERLLRHDQLTGLLNRHALDEELETTRPGYSTLLFFDIDRFKAINDDFGHHVGDLSLTRFARILREHFREGDLLVRYAGDEFMVVTGETGDAAVQKRIAEIRSRLATPGARGEPPLQFSVGSVKFTPGEDLEAAIRFADSAMYEEKRHKHADP